jgi:hypothetical protein
MRYMGVQNAIHGDCGPGWLFCSDCIFSSGDRSWEKGNIAS